MAIDVGIVISLKEKLKGVGKEEEEKEEEGKEKEEVKEEKDVK